MKNPITVKVQINAPVEKVWEMWTAPRHIIAWNQPSAEWHTTRVENEPVAGGKFLYEMHAKNGNGGFDFKGRYDEVIPLQKMSYTLDDGRKTTNLFTAEGNSTSITETFEPEQQTPRDEQERFCASVLETFKNYVESLT